MSASVDQQVRQQQTVQAIAPSYPCLRAFALLHDGKWSPLELLGLILDSSNDDADFANTHVHKVLR